MSREAILIIIIGMAAIIACATVHHTRVEAAQDKTFAEGSVDQKLDALYQQNKEIKQAIEECKVWILAK